MCRVGKVLNVLDNRSAVTLHVYCARTDHRLQVAWSPQYSALEGHVYQQQVIETVAAEKVLGVVELSDKGVLNHASATQLAKLGWRIGETVVGK